MCTHGQFKGTQKAKQSLGNCECSPQSLVLVQRKAACKTERKGLVYVSKDTWLWQTTILFLSVTTTPRKIILQYMCLSSQETPSRPVKSLPGTQGRPDLTLLIFLRFKSSRKKEYIFFLWPSYMPLTKEDKAQVKKILCRLSLLSLYFIQLLEK